MLQVRLRAHGKATSAEAADQKLMLKAMLSRIEELRELMPDTINARGGDGGGAPADAAAAAASNRSGGGSSLLSRAWQSTLLTGVRRAASGIMSVSLYYADVVSMHGQAPIRLIRMPIPSYSPHTSPRTSPRTFLNISLPMPMLMRLLDR